MPSGRKVQTHCKLGHLKTKPKKDGFLYCKICTKVNNEKAKFRRFGLTEPLFVLKKIQQKDSCPCGVTFGVGQKYGPRIDHDHNCCPPTHSCGLCVRGLLCFRCNIVLGMLDENPKLLPEYLNNYLNAYKDRRDSGDDGYLKTGLLTPTDCGNLILAAQEVDGTQRGSDKFLELCERLFINKLAEKSETERLLKIR